MAEAGEVILSDAFHPEYLRPSQAERELKRGTVQIREMRETDIAQVEAIEQEIFSVPWSEKSFLSACTTPENIYLVCLAGEEVAGYCGLWECGLAKAISPIWQWQKNTAETEWRKR